MRTGRWGRGPHDASHVIGVTLEGEAGSAVVGPMHEDAVVVTCRSEDVIVVPVHVVDLLCSSVGAPIFHDAAKE